MIAKTRKGRERLGAFSIMSMSVEDIPGVVEIENLSFPTPWSESSFRYELQENPYASLFVARTRELTTVIAFACLWIVDQEVKINNIAVHPAYRARGVGTRFLRDRKSTRLNSSHGYISYAVFCLKKKKTSNNDERSFSTV